MKIRLMHLWMVVSTGYWFVPSVMSVGAAIMAFLLLYFDDGPGELGNYIPWLYSGGSQGARTLLSTVAASVITVAGVVFSITIAALTLASGQFGPRLLRNFMRNRANQFVLGTFVATFLFCLLVLRTVRDKAHDEQAFVPQLSVTAAVVLAVASIVVFIFFIHHVAVSLQAPHVIASVRDEFNARLEQLQNRRQKDAEDPRAGEQELDTGMLDGQSVPVCSKKEGYVQALDYDALCRLGAEHRVIFHVLCRPGDYIICGQTIAQVFSAPQGIADLSTPVNEAVICGVAGTPEQDVEFSIHQLVEIAVRALSPGINDPFTALNCIDTLRSMVIGLSGDTLPPPQFRDANGHLRVVASVSTFPGIVDSAFNQIRQYGRHSVAVVLRLLETLTFCIKEVRGEQDRKELFRHARMVYDQSQSPEAIPEQHDRDEAHKRWLGVLDAMGIAEGGRIKA